MLRLTWFWRHASSLCSHQLLWQIPHADQPDSHLWRNLQELPCNSSGLCRTWVNYHVVLHTVCPMICVQNKDIVSVCIIKTFQGQWSYVIENTKSNVSIATTEVCPKIHKENTRNYSSHTEWGGGDNFILYTKWRQQWKIGNINIMDPPSFEPSLSSQPTE